MADSGTLVVFLLLVVAAVFPSAFFRPGAWYDQINKPWWTPPDGVFPIAWTILYTVIAIAGWLAWRAGGWSPAIGIWGVGLVINALWSYFMFGRQDIASALVDVVALWIATAAFILAAWPLDERAAYLFIPYLLWVSYAAALNYEIWRTN